MKLSSYKIILIITALIVLISLVGIAIAFYSSYIGYYGYNKDKARSFSNSVEESKERKVFIKELNFSVSPDSFVINNAFIEKAYRWGSSSRSTRPLDPKDTIEGCLVNYPYQVVLSFPSKQYEGNVRIGSKFNNLHSRAYYPIQQLNFNDTVFFHLVYSKGFNPGFAGEVKVWDK